MYIFNMVNKVSKVLLRNRDIQDNQIRKQTILLATMRISSAILSPLK